MDSKLLDILVCPLCKGPLVYKKNEQELICKADRLAFPIRDDIPVMAGGRSAQAGRNRRSLMTDFIAVIPARYASTRLPAKPLADIAGKPMVVRVAERAAQSGASAVWVAADDERIITAVKEHGYQALLTSTHHTSGTDRLAEVMDMLSLDDDTIVVNVQGDEPLIDPVLIHAVARELRLHPEAVMCDRLPCNS